MRCRDYQAIIDLLMATIQSNQREEELFRRSAEASCGETARLILNEIADELQSTIAYFEAMMQKLVEEKNMEKERESKTI